MWCGVATDAVELGLDEVEVEDDEEVDDGDVVDADVDDEDVEVELAGVADCCPLCWAFVLLPEPDPHPIYRPVVVKSNKTLKNRSIAVLMKSPGRCWDLARDYVGIDILDIGYTA